MHHGVQNRWVFSFNVLKVRKQTSKIDENYYLFMGSSLQEKELLNIDMSIRNFLNEEIGVLSSIIENSGISIIRLTPSFRQQNSSEKPKIIFFAKSNHINIKPAKK